MPKPRPPTFAQLCAIARDEIAAERSIDDAEWKERIRCTLARRHLQRPARHVISEAMDRVERALVRTWGPRPVHAPPPLPELTDDEHHTSRDVPPLTHDEARAVLTQLHARFGPLPAMKPRTMPSPESDGLMNTRERYHTVALIEQLREVRRQQRARAATPAEVERALGDVPRDGHSAAQGEHAGVRAEVVGGAGGGGRDDGAGHRDE